MEWYLFIFLKHALIITENSNVGSRIVEFSKKFYDNSKSSQAGKFSPRRGEILGDYVNGTGARNMHILVRNIINATRRNNQCVNRPVMF